MQEKVLHTIKPVYDKMSRVLMLGTMPSPKSREAQFFYMHPQNRFWKVLSAVMEQSVPETIEQKKRFLLASKIAVWDVLKSCTIDGASDASIKDEVPNNLIPIIKSSDIKAIFATGTKAAALYKKYQQTSTNIDIITLPSTSPANCRVSFAELVERYSIIKQFI